MSTLVLPIDFRWSGKLKNRMLWPLSRFHKLIWVFNYGKLIQNSIYLISSPRKINRQGSAYTLGGRAKCSSEGSSPLYIVSSGPTSVCSVRRDQAPANYHVWHQKCFRFWSCSHPGTFEKTLLTEPPLYKKFNALDMRTFLIQTLGLGMFNL